MTDMMPTVMTPEHPRWKEFYVRLKGPKSCNFQRTPDGKAISNCEGDVQKPLARAILESMKGIDLERSLEYFTRHGGYCDCEILFNVERAYLREHKQKGN